MAEEEPSTRVVHRLHERLARQGIDVQAFREIALNRHLEDIETWDDFIGLFRCGPTVLWIDRNTFIENFEGFSANIPDIDETFCLSTKNDNDDDDDYTFLGLFTDETEQATPIMSHLVTLVMQMDGSRDIEVGGLHELPLLLPLSLDALERLVGSNGNRCVSFWLHSFRSRAVSFARKLD